MKKMIILFLFICCFGSCSGNTKTEEYFVADTTRLPEFADQFYSANPEILKRTIKTFLDDAAPNLGVEPVAIIVPHAGYIYSGQIAADAYNQVKKIKYDLIVILGTNHTKAGFSKFAIYPNGEFASPLGAASINASAAKELLDMNDDVIADPSVHAKEHSIEVQIPFIKYLFPEAEILPIVIANSDVGKFEKFGKSLAALLKNKKALIIASSDLSHYPSFDEAVKTDNNTLKTIASLDLKKIKSGMRISESSMRSGLSTCACGEAPILTAVAAAKELGCNASKVISYSNSGYNSIGDVNRVVGYGSLVIYKGAGGEDRDIDSLISDPTYSFSNEEKKILLSYARKTLEQYFSTQTVPLPRGFSEKLKLKRGAFVTLKKHGELRGCIGHMAENAPLSTTVGSMALQAAFGDPRFSQLKEEELAEVEIEISVLTPLKVIGGAEDIILGRDGVLIKKGNNQAVYLPQVATETGWDKETFLNQLCYKAGLRKGDWKDAQLFSFQADVFSEAEFN